MIAQQSTRRLRTAAVVLTLVVLAACGTAPTRAPTGEREIAPTARVGVTRSLGERAATIAMRQLGTPYRYGGSGPAGFDCSGLVHYSYREAGKPVPRTTRQLWKESATVGRADLWPGDLLFFSIEGKMQHVGLYIGGDRFIHAPSTGKRVQVESLNSGFYNEALLRSARLR